MAEIREFVEVSRQKAHNAILEMLGRIKEQSQNLFSNQLKYGLQPPDLETCLSPEFYYLGEVDRRWWLGPWWGSFRKRRLLFVVRWPNKKKEITCTLFEKSILGIVKEEVRKVAEAFNVSVNLHQRFADRTASIKLIVHKRCRAEEAPVTNLLSNPSPTQSGAIFFSPGITQRNRSVLSCYT